MDFGKTVLIGVAHDIQWPSEFHIAMLQTLQCRGNGIELQSMAVFGILCIKLQMLLGTGATIYQ